MMKTFGLLVAAGLLMVVMWYLGYSEGWRDGRTDLIVNTFDVASPRQKEILRELNRKELER